MKHTLPIIEKTLKSYVDKLFQIDVETDSEFIAAVKKAKDELLADIVVLRDQNPELFYLNYEKTLGEDSAKEIIKKISKNAFSHYGLDTLPSTEFFIDKVQGDTIVTPSFVPTWDTTYVDLELPQGAILKDVLNSFLLNLMLSLPIKMSQHIIGSILLLSIQPCAVSIRFGLMIQPPCVRYKNTIPS
mgnify:CR=1 FL=1